MTVQRTGNRRTRKIVLWGAVAVGGLLILALALAPTIGSSLAPGIIEGSVNPGIKGRVKIAKASIGWFSGLQAGPIEVFDAEGTRAANLTASAPLVTAWRALAGRYWSARSLDLGTVEVSGAVDLLQYNDGTTNLDRAFAPKDPGAVKPKPAKTAKADRPLPAVKATAKITQFDATVRNESDNFRSQIGLKGLTGEAVIDADLSARGGGVAKVNADFSGTAITPGGDSSGAPMTFKADADVRQTAGGGWGPEGIENAKVKLLLTNAPIGVVDALASMGGALVEGVGDTADVSAEIDGNTSSMVGTMTVVSAGVNADANLTINEGVLTATASKPSTLSIRSTDFLQNLPQTREGVAKAGQQLKLTKAPSIQVTLESLRVPVPKPGAGAGQAQDMDLSTLDFRGASLVAKVSVSGVSGEVLLPQEGGTGATPVGAGNWKPFTIEPLELIVNIPDLAQPINISTGTKATLDGQPAGDVAVAISAAGLLNAAGHLRVLAKSGDAGVADKADASVRIAGVSTALIQPIISGALKTVPVDLALDVGPTLDLNLTAKADVAGVRGAGDVGGAIETLPPMDITADINSRNIKGDIAARLDKAVLTTRGDGISLSIASAAPMADRILRSVREAAQRTAASAPASGEPAAAPTPPLQIALSGVGKIDLTARDLAVSLKQGDTTPEAILARGRGTLNLVLSDLGAAVDMGGSTAPVQIERQSIAMVLAPGTAPKVNLDGRLSHEGRPFTITGGYALEGLRTGVPQVSGPGALSAYGPVGLIEIKGAPRSLLGIVPATAGYASAGAAPADATEMARAITGLVREAIGETADVGLRFLVAPADKGGGHYASVKVETAGTGGPAGGTGADVWLRVTAKEAEVSTLTARLPLDPRGVNPLLAAIGKPADAPAAGGAPAPTPMRLGAPTKMHFTLDKPVLIPLIADAAGATTPDWARAGTVNLKTSVEGDLLVENVAVGGGGVDADGRAVPVRLANLALSAISATIGAPLSGIPAEARATNRISMKASATARNRTVGSIPLAQLALDATAFMDGTSPDATAHLSEINTQAVEDLLGKKDLLVGAMGDTAEVKVRIQPVAAGAGGGAGRATVGQVLSLESEITSPRISGGKVAFSKDDEHLWLTRPSSITWTPNAAFINRFILGGTAAQPAAAPGRDRPAAGGGPSAPLSLEDARPISINIARLAMSMPASDEAGNPTRGPMKPGVFEMDMAVTAPSMSVIVAPTKAGQAPSKLTIQGLNLSASAPKAAGGRAGAEAAPIELNLSIDRVTGAGADAGKRSTAKVQVMRAADNRGVVTADSAVINADVDIAAFPTPIIDNLANQNGLMTEALGPTVTLLARARNVTRGADVAGDVSMEANSSRATASLKGDVRKGQFVQSGPVSIELREIRSQLVAALAGSLPIVETLEKTPPDEPATLVAEGLSVPLDNDLRKLNGKLTVNPGVARFTTNNILGQLVKGLGGQQSGTLGRKIQPFVININQGVAVYDRFELPVGEFKVETRGTVDLVQRRINVVTYVPFFALTDEGLGLLNLGLAGKLGGIDKNTLIPITTKGSMDKPETKLDLELFLKETGDRLIKQPGRIIEDVIGDLLKPKDPKK